MLDGVGGVCALLRLLLLEGLEMKEKKKREQFFEALSVGGGYDEIFSFNGLPNSSTRRVINLNLNESRKQ